MKLRTAFLFALFLTISLFDVHSVFAQTNGFVPLADIGGSAGGGKLSQIYSSGSLSGYVNSLFTFALSLGAVLAVLRIAYGGYLYMGSDSWGNKSEARKVIGGAVIGLLLLLSIWLILNQINPHILDLNALSNVS